MVYTAIVGGKDKSRSDVKVFESSGMFKDPRMEAKRYKVLSHLYVEGEVSVWVDGNRRLRVPEEEFVGLLGDADLALFKHSGRHTVKQEVEELERLNWGGLKAFKSTALYEEKFPLGECGVLLRRQGATRRFNEIWWALICRYHVRDQITFPTAARLAVEEGLKFRWLPGCMNNNKWVERWDHLF